MRTIENITQSITVKINYEDSTHHEITFNRWVEDSKIISVNVQGLPRDTLDYRNKLLLADVDNQIALALLKEGLIGTGGMLFDINCSKWRKKVKAHLASVKKRGDV